MHPSISNDSAVPLGHTWLRHTCGIAAATTRHSKPSRSRSQSSYNGGGPQTVESSCDTGDLYRYFDATTFAEYLYDRVADTVRRDLKEELGFVSVFDRALAEVREIVDMPDRHASFFVRLCMQNGGRLSAAKRDFLPN
jgi:hypothetical protein